MRRAIGVLVVGMLAGGVAQAAERPIVAVFDLEVKGATLDRDMVDRLTDYLGSLLANKGLQVIPRSQLKERLLESKKGSYKACYDESCQIEVGKELAAQKTLAGQILKLGSMCKVTLNLFDLKKAASEGAGTASGGCGEDQVVESLEKAVANLFESAKVAPPVAPAETKPENLSYAELAARAAAEQEQRRASLEQAWGEVSRLAVDRGTPHAARALVVRKFLQDFSGNNPYQPMARRCLARLESDQEPMLKEEEVAWVFSKPAGLELTKSEVTVGQYRACVEAGKCSAPQTGGSCNFGQAGRDKHPVNCVDWNQATAFCEWAGGRLPTEEEWYAEASAGGKRKYPWGDEEVSCERAIWSQGGSGCGKGSTWPVCSKPAGNSVSGLCDLSGNVWEWTSSSEGSARVVRGGSWFIDPPDALRAAYRSRDVPTYGHDYSGFRCGRSSR